MNQNTNNMLSKAKPIGFWNFGLNGILKEQKDDFQKAIYSLNEPFFVVMNHGNYAIAQGGYAQISTENTESGLPLFAYIPAYSLQNLGDRSFCDDHGLSHPYIAGAMAHGINSLALVETLAQNGMLSFFGSAGQSPEKVKEAIVYLSSKLHGKPYGFNLIHSPGEPGLEDSIVRLYLERNICLVEASAYLDLTLPLVRYRLAGIHSDSDGRIITPHKIIAKVSRIELAEKFFSPPPEKLVAELVKNGTITQQQASLARHIPMAQDLTVEADSGGHTDNRPTFGLVPTMLALRNRLQKQYNFAQSLRVGVAGGIATPLSVAAAFSMGAAYIVTGSINQACVESGTSDTVREMLAQTQQADVTMAHAADMFEMGVKVQVIKRGTMFAMRSAKLYDIYHQYESIESIPVSIRESLEKQYFHSTIEKVWAGTCQYFEERDPSQIAKAMKNPKYKMALIFRWYLGQTSRWAISGLPERKIDYQIWCGPAMGAFNEWAKDSFLEKPQNRKAANVAKNLLYGGVTIMRMNYLQSCGISLDYTSMLPKPMTDIEMQSFF